VGAARHALDRRAHHQANALSGAPQ
jgi:hypothetical protein